MNKLTDNERLESFSHLIGLIYESAQSPELWPELLQKLDELISQIEPASDDIAAVVQKRGPHLDVLRPHFQRALQLNKKLYELKNERDAVSNILDRLPIGVVLVDGKLAVAAINRHAEKIIKAAATVTIHEGRLVADSAADTKQIEQYVSRAIASPDASVKGWNLRLAADSPAPCSLYITPSAHTAIEAEKKLVAIFITCAGIGRTIGVESLAESYRLTQAESRLLQTLLNSSHSLSEAADLLGVSKFTVRSQFKSILEKTGTHSQTELLKQILTGPAMLTTDAESPADENRKLPEIQSIEAIDQYGSYRILKLMDGRRLEYREFGNPSGVPVIYFHGILHSKRKFHPYSHYINDHDIRVIAPERPGFGNTDRQKDRSISNFCGDILQLADHLGIDRFYTFGDGDGGPWALAMACLMPERVIRAAVSGCMPDPQFEHLENLLPFDRKLQRLAHVTPKPILYSFSKIVLKALKRNNNYFELMGEDFHESDRKIITSKEHKALFHDAMECISNDHIEGFIDDYFSRQDPWDFPIRQIETEVHLWHGVHDCFSNIESARDIAAALTNCRTYFIPDHGHYIFISHCDDILARLVEA